MNLIRYSYQIFLESPVVGLYRDVADREQGKDPDTGKVGRDGPPRLASQQSKEAVQDIGFEL